MKIHLLHQQIPMGRGIERVTEMLQSWFAKSVLELLTRFAAWFRIFAGDSALPPL